MNKKYLSITSESFNEKRKEILLKLDNANDSKVSNIDLSFYDLTPYIIEGDFDCSLAEKLISIKKEQDAIKHINNSKISLVSEQKKAIGFILEHDRVIISAPTSFGKTLLLKEYIYREKPRIVVYIVPTNALAYELENDFKKNESFSNYEIFDKMKDNSHEENDYILFIGTQERYLEIKNSINAPINLFVIDEAYKLDDGTETQRGYQLSESFLDSIDGNSEKVILLSPNARFIGFEKYHFVIFDTKFNIVDRVVTTVAEDKILNLVQECANKGEKTMLYCESPNVVNSVADEISQLNYSDANFAKQLSEEFHGEWSVVKLLKKGVLTHHGLMPKYVQNKMIGLFVNSDKYNLIVGTKSVSEGINTPTKNLFIHPNTDLVKDKLLIRNTIGRAGRLGKYPIGHIFTSESLDEVLRSDSDITLSISKDESMNEIKNTKDEELINRICDERSIKKDFYDRITKKYRLSIKKLDLILRELQKEIRFPKSLDALPTIAHTVFISEYKPPDYLEDKVFIKGVFQSYYIDDKKSVYLDGYESKINYYYHRKKKLEDDESKFKLRCNSKSEIIDGYIKFIYSSLDYYIFPIMQLGRELSLEYEEWPFGKNIPSLIEYFFERYFDTFYGYNIETLSDSQKKIAFTLKEYGVPIKELRLKKEILDEIEKKLNVRYSTLDIINAITQLSKESQSNANTYLHIVKKYFAN